MKQDCFAYIDKSGGSCKVLTSNDCDHCKFYKTIAEYKQEYDKAVQRNRKSGACTLCKYQLKKCKKYSEDIKLYI